MFESGTRIKGSSTGAAGDRRTSKRPRAGQRGAEERALPAGNLRGGGWGWGAGRTRRGPRRLDGADGLRSLLARWDDLGSSQR